MRYIGLLDGSAVYDGTYSCEFFGRRLILAVLKITLAIRDSPAPGENVESDRVQSRFAFRTRSTRTIRKTRKIKREAFTCV